MPITINGTTGIAGVDGTAATPAVQGGDSNTGVFFPAADTVAVSTAGVEAMRIDSSGNVGIGRTPTSLLNLYSATAAQLLINGDATTNVSLDRASTDTTGPVLGWRKRRGTTASPLAVVSGDITGTINYAAYDGSALQVTSQIINGVETFTGVNDVSGYLTLSTRPTGSSAVLTERMRIDATGNVGIGTTSTYGYKMFVLGGANSGVAVSDNTNSVYMMGDGGTTVMVGTPNSVPLRFNTAATERMRISAAGHVLVGRTTAYNDGSIGTPGFQSASVTGSAAGGAFIASTTSATTQIGFVNPNGTVGTISSTGTATAYTTSSDYRLKENVQPMTGALDTIAQLNPVTYNWKVDGSDGQGFIAHELQAVVPDCVSGEKDAVDDEGRPRYQGVDTSFLVATLVSAIQELTARIAALEAK